MLIIHTNYPRKITKEFYLIEWFCCIRPDSANANTVQFTKQRGMYGCSMQAVGGYLQILEKKQVSSNEDK